MDTFEKLIAPERAALIIVDVQNDYCHPRGSLGCAGADLAAVAPAVVNIERLILGARESGAAVIFPRRGRAQLGRRILQDRAAGRRADHHQIPL